MKLLHSSDKDLSVIKLCLFIVLYSDYSACAAEFISNIAACKKTVEVMSRSSNVVTRARTMLCAINRKGSAVNLIIISTIAGGQLASRLVIKFTPTDTDR